MKLYKLIICVLTLILSLMITSCNSSVTLDEWNDAVKIENFENVVVKFSETDGNGEVLYQNIIKFDENIIYGYSDMPKENGEVEQLQKYLYQDETGTWELEYDSVDKIWYKHSDHYMYEDVKYFFYTIREYQYSEFTYDENEHCYFAKINGYNTYIYFTNGKISKIVNKLLNGTNESEVYEFSSYNKVTLELPNESEIVYDDSHLIYPLC